MPTLTLKDVPRRVHHRLTARAAQNGRSPADEALAILETSLGAPPVEVEKRLARVQAIRARYALQPVEPGDIDADKRLGRP